MKLLVIGIFDKAADLYVNTIFVHSVGLATRQFTDELNRTDANNQMNLHPADFTLWHLGDYDNATGVLTPHEKRCIARGIDHYQGEERPPTVYDPNTVKAEITNGGRI